MIKKKITLILVFVSTFIYSTDNYFYKVNLTKVENDRLTVSLIPPNILENESIFSFAAMVPGTYEVYDFGKYISNFKVKGKNNTTITITKLNVNEYKISPANQIEEILYEVDDTFDYCNIPDFRKKIVFEPAGSSFEEGKNFSINTHCLFGYFKNYLNKKFILEFEKPLGFYPITGLTELKIGNTKDTISVFDYHDLVDSPIMYAKPDTATVIVGNAKVLVGSYSPNKLITANFIKNTLEELLLVQRDYLGGTLPVDKYAFIFYFADKIPLSGSSGALEHSYSSFYVLPETDSSYLKQTLRDVSAHEFFHIVTPLNIHAKQIGEFDFNNPQMSEHLWLYEGMTEYAAHHAQCKGGLITVDRFIEEMMNKYENSIEQYNDTMSFTWMSKNVLKDKIHKQYNNVYEKGAVIGMCLDIMLRDLSDGKYGTQNLMKDLSKKYGKHKSFNDEDLFNDIEKLTYPPIGDFLRTYVSGNKPLPLKDILNRIGILFDSKIKTKEYTFGNPEISYNPNTKRLLIASVKEVDEFGKKLKFKKGDELSKLNGKELTIENIQSVFSEFYKNIKEGDWVSFEIYRPKKNKSYKIKTLKAKAFKVDVVRSNQIKINETMNSKQKQTLRAWVGNN